MENHSYRIRVLNKNAYDMLKRIKALSGAFTPEVSEILGTLCNVFQSPYDARTQDELRRYIPILIDSRSREVFPVLRSALDTLVQDLKMFVALDLDELEQAWCGPCLA